MRLKELVWFGIPVIGSAFLGPNLLYITSVETGSKRGRSFECVLLVVGKGDRKSVV